MQVFVDGLPLHKSGQNQLWPILVKIEELPDAPVMVAGVFCGQTKPQHVEDFLRPFVNEMNELRQVSLYCRVPVMSDIGRTLRFISTLSCGTLDNTTAKRVWGAMSITSSM
uniref:Uncharacterized protein n=1 Tax=Anopheles atroparvus TaxID=41427 RepID=A0A182J949_ANOAO